MEATARYVHKSSRKQKRQFCKLIFILLCRSSTIIFDPTLSDSLLKCMRETAQDLSTTQKLCIICSRQNFETVQVLCSVFCQPSTIFMLFSWFFLVDLPFSILVFHASLGKVTVNLFINIDHIIINYKSMISKSLISTFLSKSEWIIRTTFFKTMSIPSYDEVTFRKYIKVTFFKG